MNPTIDLLTSRRSYRNFDTDYEIPQDQLDAILRAARQAPTWQNGQYYSIIVLRDKAIRKQIVEFAGSNPQILESSVFILFIADLHRSERIAEHLGKPYYITDSINPLLVTTADAALAMQNAVTAAQSLGLGSVVVGGVRNATSQITELLHLPPHTAPLFGVSIGKPTVEMKVKPRLPEEAVIHYDTYKEYPYELIDQYVDTLIEFAEARETMNWDKKTAKFVAEAGEIDFDKTLRAQKLLK
jgi:FMN reductase [NAD(P)H]